jgi:serine/threonine protein kinase
LLELIHEGSCGVIYRARQDRLGRIVALKLLPEWPPPTDVALERFNRAAYVSAQAPNPNLVTLFDTGTIDGFHYSSLEFLSGQTLQKHLSVVNLADEAFAMNVAVQVLRALAALHARDICHRNVKPKNIFIESSGNVRLIGLGLASCRTAFFSPHLDARPIGTPHFMAPEMIRGSYADARSDIYSLGVTLYVLTSGQTPFEKGSPLAVMSRHLTDEAIPLGKARPGLSSEFVTFVNMLMAREPEHRFQSAKAALEVAEALMKNMNAWPLPALQMPQPEPSAAPLVQPQFPRPLRQPERAWHSHPLVVASAAVAATLLFLASLWVVVTKAGRPAQPGATEQGAPQQTPDASKARDPGAPVDGAEKAEFGKLVEMDDEFRVSPANGADAWAAYLARFPNAPAAKRAIARQRLDLYLNLDDARRKKAEQKPEHLDF